MRWLVSFLYKATTREAVTSRIWFSFQLFGKLFEPLEKSSGFFLS